MYNYILLKIIDNDLEKNNIEFKLKPFPHQDKKDDWINKNSGNPSKEFVDLINREYERLTKEELGKTLFVMNIKDIMGKLSTHLNNDEYSKIFNYLNKNLYPTNLDVEMYIVLSYKVISMSHLIKFNIANEEGYLDFSVSSVSEVQQKLRDANDFFKNFYKDKIVNDEDDKIFFKKEDVKMNLTEKNDVNVLPFDIESKQTNEYYELENTSQISNNKGWNYSFNSFKPATSYKEDTSYKCEKLINDRDSQEFEPNFYNIPELLYDYKKNVDDLTPESVINDEQDKIYIIHNTRIYNCVTLDNRYVKYLLKYKLFNDLFSYDIVSIRTNNPHIKENLLDTCKTTLFYDVLSLNNSIMSTIKKYEKDNSYVIDDGIIITKKQNEKILITELKAHIFSNQRVYKFINDANKENIFDSTIKYLVSNGCKYLIINNKTYLSGLYIKG